MELLVVIGIIGALASVAIPVVGRFMGSSDATANVGELINVQSAMDTYMADTSVNVVTANAVATSLFSAPVDPPLSPDYLRSATTKCQYTWAADGQVTQGPCP